MCRACDHRFEEFHSITADPVDTCPVCGKQQVTRLLSGGSGLIFKGSGFYITDYKKKKTSTTESEKSEKKPESKETKKPETKPKN
jgi:putative FmdB family regulatory protein